MTNAFILKGEIRAKKPIFHLTCTKYTTITNYKYNLNNISFHCLQDKNVPN